MCLGCHLADVVDGLTQPEVGQAAVVFTSLMGIVAKSVVVAAIRGALYDENAVIEVNDDLVPAGILAYTLRHILDEIILRSWVDVVVPVQQAGGLVGSSNDLVSDSIHKSSKWI